MILTSTKPLSTGAHTMRTSSGQSIWICAAYEGLTQEEYGRTWWVYETDAEHQASLD